MSHMSHGSHSTTTSVQIRVISRSPSSLYFFTSPWNFNDRHPLFLDIERHLNFEFYILPWIYFFYCHKNAISAGITANCNDFLLESYDCGSGAGRMMHARLFALNTTQWRFIILHQSVYITHSSAFLFYKKILFFRCLEIGKKKRKKRKDKMNLRGRESSFLEFCALSNWMI